MKFTRMIALILAVLTLLMSLAACGDSTPEKKKRKRSESGSSADNNFPSADYNNDDFTFLTITNEGMGKDYYCGNYIDSEAITGDTISDSVFERNLAVEEKYNVNIVERQEFGSPPEVLRMFVMSGDFCYDVIYGWGYKMGSCITENYLSDFNALPNVDLTQEYWSPSAMEDLTIAGHNYLCINDISMNKLEWAKFIFFNKQIAEDYNVYTEFGDLYQMVRDGSWTMDKFFSIVTSISNDIDGNGVITKDDVYGFLDGTTSASDFALTSGIKLATMNEDGTYSPSFYNEKMLDIIEKVTPIYANKKCVLGFGDTLAGVADMSGYTDQFEYSRSFFAKDHALFMGGSAYMTGEFRDMKSAYGVLPTPKYDKNQEDYISIMYSLASIFGIPATPRNDVSSASPERTGTILNYMAYKSNEILLPTYYDTVLGGQRFDSPDDSEMLDIIRSNTHYVFTDINGIGWPANANDSEFNAVLLQMFSNPSSATSTYKRSEKKLQKLLDDFYLKVVELDERNNKNKD